MPARRRSIETGALARRQTPPALPHAAATPSAVQWEPKAWAGHVAQRPADPPMTPAQAEEVASQVDFRFELASASNHYEALGQCVRDIKAAAEHFRSEWQASGDHDCLAMARHLPIRGTLLDSLHALRAHHKDWLSSTHVVSPATLAYLLRFFSDALRACEAQPDAVKLLPMAGVHAALKHMKTQVEASQQSLATGQWQTTVEGQWHAEKFRARQARDPDARRPLADPFDEVKVACRNLDGIVARLLTEGPAPDEPPKETTAATEPVPQALAQAPEQGPSVPAAQSQAATTPAGIQKRSFKSVLTDGLPVPLHADTGPRQPTLPAAPDWTTPRSTAPAARPVETRPGHEKRVDSGTSSQARQSASRPVLPKPADFTPLPTPEAIPTSVAAVIAAPPADPAVEAAARVRQQQIDDLRGALAPLQTKAEHSLKEARKVPKAATAAGGLPWSGSSLELAAWRAAGEAHDQWERELPKAGALVGLDRGDPEMRSLEQKISKATRSVLASVAKAADNELAAVSRACNAALIQRGTPNEGPMSHADLAARCDELRDQWKQEGNDTSLGSRIPGQRARMEQYSAYDQVLSAMHSEPGDVAAALDKAEKLSEATLSSQRASPGTRGALADPLSAFHKFCTQARSKLLLKAVHLQIKDVEATYVELGTPLRPVLVRSQEVATAYDVLLAGAPLPDEKYEAKHQTPGPQAGAAQPASGKAEADPSLVEQAHQAAARASALRKQHKTAIVLPADAPQQAQRELEAGLTVLGQLELTSRTAAETISRFHDLSTALGLADPAAEPHAVAKERLATVQRHAEAMKTLTKELRQASQAQADLLTQASPRWVLDLVERSNALLRADHRHAERTLTALETLEQLQLLRGSALTIRDEFRQNKLEGVARPEVLGKEHASVLSRLGSGMKTVEQRLQREVGVINRGAMAAETARHERCAEALEIRVQGDQALMQSQLLLAWAEKAREQNSGNLRPAQIPALEGPLTILRRKLVNIDKAIVEHAASSEHKGSYESQIAVNQKVRSDLVRLQVELDRMQTPGSSSQADEPAAPPAGTAPAAAQARQAPQKGPSPKHARRSKRR